MAWPLVAMGLASGAMQWYGQNQQQKQQNQYAQQAGQMWSPQQINQNAAMFMPQYGQTNQAWGQQMNNLAMNPGYIDPAVRNQPFHLSAQRMNQDVNRAGSILGKTTGGLSTSGIGNSSVMGALGARTQRDVNTSQQYSLWRENQRRQDLALVGGALNNARGGGFNSAQGQSGAMMQQQAPTNMFQGGGQMMAGGMPFMPGYQQYYGQQNSNGPGAPNAPGSAGGYWDNNNSAYPTSNSNG